MRLAEAKKIVPILSSADINAGVDSDSFRLTQAHHVTLLVQFGPSLSGDAVLKVYSGASAGTKTTAETFNYRYGGAAIGSASADVYSSETTSAALTCTGTTFVSRLLIIEFDASDVTEDQEWITVEISSAAGAGELSIVAILEPRYPGATIPTAIA